MDDSKPELQREIDAKAVRAGTKQSIVEAATFEFANHGLDGARIDRIARSAKVNKAMIYYHFESKDNLYLEVVTSYFRKIGERAKETVLSSPTLEEALIGLAALHESMVTDDEYARPMILRELANPRPQVLEAIVNIFGTVGVPQKVAALMADGTERGEFRPVNLQQALVAFASMSLYYPLMSPFIDRLLNIESPREFRAERQKVIVEIFLNGLKAR